MFWTVFFMILTIGAYTAPIWGITIGFTVLVHYTKKSARDRARIASSKEIEKWDNNFSRAVHTSAMVHTHHAHASTSNILSYLLAEKLFSRTFEKEYNKENERIRAERCLQSDTRRKAQQQTSELYSSLVKQQMEDFKRQEEERKEREAYMASIRKRLEEAQGYSKV